MKKRFIVKSVVSDYAVFDTLMPETEQLECICSGKRNADLIADILNTDHSKPNECTYYKNELLQENKQLKERIQNILEGKEIPAICAKKYEEYEEQLTEKDKQLEIYKNLERYDVGKLLNENIKLRAKINTIRKQVCNKIKDFINKYDAIKPKQLFVMDLSRKLDQIEQAKEN